MNEFEKLERMIIDEGYYAKFRNSGENNPIIMVGTNVQKLEMGLNMIVNTHFISNINGIWRIEVPTSAKQREPEALFTATDIESIFNITRKYLKELKNGNNAK